MFCDRSLFPQPTASAVNLHHLVNLPIATFSRWWFTNRLLCAKSNWQWEPHVWRETLWTCSAHVGTRGTVCWVKASVEWTAFSCCVSVPGYCWKTCVSWFNKQPQQLLSPHVENLWPASTVVCASLSVAGSAAVSGCRGDMCVSAIGRVMYVCVCGGGRWKDSMEADRVALCGKKHIHMSTGTGNLWKCSDMLGLKLEQELRTLGGHTHRYPDSTQATAMHSYWQLRAIRLPTGKSEPAAALWTLIVCVHTFIHSLEPEDKV